MLEIQDLTKQYGKYLAKLSKRNGDASFQDLVKKGYLPQAILNYIALLGWAPEGEQEIFTLEELIRVFDIKRISKSPAIFDLNKLTWMNGMYLRALPLEQFHELALPYYREAIHTDVDLIHVSVDQQSNTPEPLPHCI